MDIDVSDWLGLALRWLHLTAGIAWIGSSFYFIWLDNHLRPPTVTKDGVSGEVWAVHGGGFYNAQKYLVAPGAMPDELHWFKWEAYTTWISGFLLLCLIYYSNAGLYLIDRAKADLSPFEAVLIGLCFIVAGWLVYDGLCRSPIGRNNKLFGLVWFFVLTAAAFALSRIFSGRGSFIHLGAVIGSVMAANVFAVIIPNQKKAVAALIAGGNPDPALGKQAKQRSVHNNYMTLPVLFIMISNHYPMIYGSPVNWLLLAGLGVVGWTIRHFFTLRHFGRVVYPLPIGAAAGFVCLMAIAATTRNPDAPQAPSISRDATFADVSSIIHTHCLSCHSARPAHPGIAAAPKGVMFDTPEEIRRYAAKIDELAVASSVMPLGNETGMTANERALLGRWIADGAKTGNSSDTGERP